MKRASKIAIGLGTALTLGLAAAAVNAHPSGWGMGGDAGWGPGHMMGYGDGPGARHGMGPGFGMGFGAGPGFGPGPQGYGNSGAFVENRLAGLKSELKITPAQEPAWNAYVEQAKSQAESMRSSMIAMHERTPATLPERLELRDQIWKERQARSEAMGQKLKDLYAALTPEQKAILDQRTGGNGPGFRGGPGYRNR